MKPKSVELLEGIDAEREAHNMKTQISVQYTIRVLTIQVRYTYGKVVWSKVFLYKVVLLYYTS